MYHIVSSGTQTGSSATNLSLKPSKAVLDKTKPKEKRNTFRTATFGGCFSSFKFE